MNSSEQLSVLECKRCNAFSIDASLLPAEHQQRMMEHLDVVHPYWELENPGVGGQDYKANFRLVSQQAREYFCTGCKTTITPKTSFCPNCGAYKTAFTDTEKQKDRLGHSGVDRRQVLGILGSILLFFGVFAPIISAPIVGNLNYFQNGRGDGVVVLVLAVVSIGLVLAKRYGGLWVTGAGSLAVLLFTFVNFQLRMSQMQEEMELKLAGNPFRGLADVAMKSVQIQWGWAILVIGAVLLIAAAALRDTAD